MNLRPMRPQHRSLVYFTVRSIAYRRTQKPRGCVLPASRPRLVCVPARRSGLPASLCFDLPWSATACRFGTNGTMGTQICSRPRTQTWMMMMMRALPHGGYASRSRRPFAATPHWPSSAAQLMHAGWPVIPAERLGTFFAGFAEFTLRTRLRSALSTRYRARLSKRREAIVSTKATSASSRFVASLPTGRA